MEGKELPPVDLEIDHSLGDEEPAAETAPPEDAGVQETADGPSGPADEDPPRTQ